ncbi:MAG: hypothetical protein Q8L34_00325 [Candidatus Woesearchaeota archaeon]|nr:hypothetical protein [Candidatus Woesearchaeota archaeon]
MTEKQRSVDPEDDSIQSRSDRTRIATMGSTVHHTEERPVTLCGSIESVDAEDRETIAAMTSGTVLTREQIANQGMHFSSPSGKRRVDGPMEYGSMAVYRTH